MAAVLALWVAVRLVTRRPIAHPWFLALAVAGAGAAVADFATTVPNGVVHTAVRQVALFAAFAAVVVFVEGLRRESGAAPARTGALLLALAGCAVASGAMAPLADTRAATAGGILISVVLLNAVVPLMQATRRRAGSWTIVGGIVVYALGRTAMVATQVAGGDVRAVLHVADVVSILSFGAGLLVYAIEGLRDERRARAAVGHRQTAG
jgi:hypothetical protein